MSQPAGQEKLEISLPDVKSVNSQIARNKNRKAIQRKPLGTLPAKVAVKRKAAQPHSSKPPKKGRRVQVEQVHVQAEESEQEEQMEDEDADETAELIEEADSDGNIVVDLQPNKQPTRSVNIPKIVLNDDWRVYVDYKDFKNGRGDLFEVFVIERYGNCARPFPWNFSMTMFPQFKNILSKLIEEYKSKTSTAVPPVEQMQHLPKDDGGFIEMPGCEYFTSRRYKYKTLLAYIEPNVFKGPAGSITQDTLILKKSFGGTGKEERWLNIVLPIGMLEPLFNAVEYVNSVWIKS